MLGAVLAAVHIIAALFLRRPTPETVLPTPKAGRAARREAFEPRDFSTAEMLRSFTFWRSFVCLVFVAAVGNSVISFARDLVLSVGAAPALAAAMVGYCFAKLFKNTNSVLLISINLLHRSYHTFRLLFQQGIWPPE